MGKGLPSQLRSQKALPLVPISNPNTIQRKIIIKPKNESEVPSEYADREKAFDSLRGRLKGISDHLLMVALEQLTEEDTKDVECEGLEELESKIRTIISDMKGRNLDNQPDLWMKSGSLEELQSSMDGQVELWETLAKKLTEYSSQAKEKINENDGLLNCGKLIIPSIEGKEPYFESKGDIPDDLFRNEIKAFLLSFMKANGQMAYMKSQDWFKDSSYKVAIEINFYPERAFSENNSTLGPHKDSESKNLFFNLIFNNTTEIPATEWTFDEKNPDHKRDEELKSLFPEKELNSIKAAKDRIGKLNTKVSGRTIWEGGTMPPNGYVSCVDELIWHSTPAMKERPTFDSLRNMGDGDSVRDLLENQNLYADKKDKEDMEIFMDRYQLQISLYEAMLIFVDSNEAVELIKNKKMTDEQLRQLKESLIDMGEWGKKFSKLHTRDGEELRDAISYGIGDMGADLSKHKLSGGVGNVDDDKGVSRIVPTKLGKRSRANSLDERKEQAGPGRYEKGEQGSHRRRGLAKTVFFTNMGDISENLKSIAALIESTLVLGCEVNCKIL